MTTPLIGRRSARNLFLSAAVIGGAAFAAAPAMAADVTAGSLTWQTQSLYRTPAGRGTPDDPTNRTWLGYVTGSPVNDFAFGANGTATPSDGATGDTVTPESPRTIDDFYAWTFGAPRGSYEPATGQGTIEFDGTLTFASPAPPSGHGFTISVEDPQVVLDGFTGTLNASGRNADRATGSYTRATPVFNLDLSNATVTLHANGSRTIAGIVPSLATLNAVFPSNYRVGAGPDRLPNTFGSFSLLVKTAPVAGPKGDKGDTGAPGPAGRNGTNGKNGTTTVVRVQTSSLAKAPFKGKTARKVRVTAKKSNKTLATGTVKGRTITFTIAKGVDKKQLKGTYVLRLVKGKGTATVRIP